jgi:hypothetical protein
MKANNEHGAVMVLSIFQEEAALHRGGKGLKIQREWSEMRFSSLAFGLSKFAVMKSLLTVVMVCSASVWGVVTGCEIADAQRIRIGLNDGVQGVCSNNGEEISCTYQQDEGWTCSGPQGQTNAFAPQGDELPQSLIDQTCGCM